MGSTRAVAILIGAGMGVALAFSGCAGMAPRKASPEMLIEDQLREDLRLPPIEADTMEWIDRLQQELAGDENFGSPVISRDRTSFTIHWYGEPSAHLLALVAEAPETLTVAIQPTDFRPGELSELVRRAVSTPALVADVEVAMGHPATDGSGITIGIVELPADRTLDQLAAEFATALDRPDVPVTAEVSGRIVPISG